MTEDDAKAQLALTVPRETIERLEAYVALLRLRSAEQNLIAASTMESVWDRHILDSAQLLPLAPGEGLWLDMGSGAGLPGLVIAALSQRPVLLVEPRAKRCQFLAEAAATLGVEDRVTILQSRAETALPADAAVISARAVAPLADLFGMGLRHAVPATKWLLPKGRNAASEVAVAETSWQARIALIPSATDSDAAIVVATDVAPRRTQRP
jgi:16S rRNA (guanine527-N7)-methyltransferase